MLSNRKYSGKAAIVLLLLVGSQMLSLGSKAKLAAMVRKQEMAAEKQRKRAERALNSCYTILLRPALTYSDTYN